MAIAVDLLILGGGIQGLALMKELAGEYSAVLVGTSLRVSETLHSHGYFSSGWNAANLEAACVYRQAAATWRSDLKQVNIPAQENPFYVVLPEQAAASLEPNWAKAGIPFQKAQFPKPFDLTRLPAHAVYHFPDDLVFDAGPVMARLQEPFVHAILEGEVTGLTVRDRTVHEVAVQMGAQSFTIAPGFVLAACGAGNATLLQMAGVPRDQVTRSQVVRPMHMVLARGRAIPDVSGVFLDLVVIAHPLENGEKIWLITHNPAEPTFTSGAIEMAGDPAVESAMVRTSLEKLAAVVPGLDEIASKCRWDVYAGWKADAPGGNPEALLRLEYPMPYDVRSFDLGNFLAVWPNHWCLATPAARLAANMVRETLKPKVASPRLPAGPIPDPDALRMKYVRSDRKWRGWREFAREYDFNE